MRASCLLLLGVLAAFCPATMAADEACYGEALRFCIEAKVPDITHDGCPTDSDLGLRPVSSCPGNPERTCDIYSVTDAEVVVGVAHLYPGSLLLRGDDCLLIDLIFNEDSAEGG